MHQSPAISIDARDVRVGIAVSQYHDAVTHALRDGAVEAFTSAGGQADCLPVVASAGAYELVAIARTLINHGKVDGIVALGCIITGETTHDQYLAHAVANGLTSLTVRYGVPITFGVLTCQTIEQARARAGGEHGNKGAEAMNALLHTLRTINALKYHEEPA
jgi:6,7-dimethyl-8-ribityllumazine synthase